MPWIQKHNLIPRTENWKPYALYRCTARSPMHSRASAPSWDEILSPRTLNSGFSPIFYFQYCLSRCAVLNQEVCYNECVIASFAIGNFDDYASRSRSASGGSRSNGPMPEISVQSACTLPRRHEIQLCYTQSYRYEHRRFRVGLFRILAAIQSAGTVIGGQTVLEHYGQYER
jgi:hypothetical protein